LCASTLPGENGTDEVSVEISKKLKKISDIIDCDFKTVDQILTVFCISFFTQLAIKWLFKFPPQRMSEIFKIW